MWSVCHGWGVATIPHMGDPTVDIIIPWANSDSWRSQALAFVTDQLDIHCPNWGVRLGHSSPNRWCKADAVADALTESTADIVVIHDADVWSPATPAIAAHAATHGWAIPHRKVYRLTPEATLDVLTSRALGMRAASPGPVSRYERVHDGFVGGGIVAVTRDVYNEVPLDPRFVGWGHEDESWAWALRLVVGAPWRGDARCYHLWHPPQDRDGVRMRGSDESWGLRNRYRMLVRERDVDGMRVLLSECSGG